MTELRASTALALFLALPLAACGGSNEGVLSAGSQPGGGTGTTPPASDYLTFSQLTGDQNFAVDITSILSKDPPHDQATGSGTNFSIRYSALTNSYTVAVYDWPEETYKLGYDKATGRTFTLDDFGGGRGLTYTRVATFSSDADGNNLVSRGIIGVPTRINDLPVGTATYQQVGFQGNATQREGDQTSFYTLANSKNELTVDFTAASLNTVMTLIGTPVGGGADKQLGVYSSTVGDTSLNAGGFRGTWTRAGATDTAGFFSGRFFGPQAAEYGMTFSIEDGGNAPTVVASGAVAGRKR